MMEAFIRNKRGGLLGGWFALGFLVACASGEGGNEPAVEMDSGLGVPDGSTGGSSAGSGGSSTGGAGSESGSGGADAAVDPGGTGSVIGGGAQNMGCSLPNFSYQYAPGECRCLYGYRFVTDAEGDYRCEPDPDQCVVES